MVVMVWYIMEVAEDEFVVEVALVMNLPLLHVMHFLSFSPICFFCGHLQHSLVERLVTRTYTNEGPG